MTGVFHGGRLDTAVSQYGGKKEDWLDLSTGINPFSYPIPEIPDDFWRRLPDFDAEQRVLEAARHFYGIDEAQGVVAANGTQALIELLPRLFKEKKPVSILSPTYGEHAHVWSKSGWDVTAIDDLSDVSPGSIVVVVNPNNPDCRVFSRSDLQMTATHAACLIIDEAFCDPTPESSFIPDLTENTIVLRSFGKFFGLAGLRLGFAVTNQVRAEELRSLVGPWSVSGPALAIGTLALSDHLWIQKTRKRLHITSKALAQLLENNGLSIEGNNPLFVFARHGDANGLFEHLARCRILVRPFPNMPQFLRFGLCDEPSLIRLEQALRTFGDV